MIAVRVRWMATFCWVAFSITGCSTSAPELGENTELSAEQEQANREAVRRAKELNRSLFDALQAYSAASAVDKGSRLEALQASAKARQDFLISVLKRTPSALVAADLKAEERQSMPKEIADQYLETEVGLEGSLEHYHQDYFAEDAKSIPQRMQHIYYLKPGHAERVPAYFADSGPRAAVNANFKIEGLLLAGKVVVKSYSSSTTGAARYQVSPDFNVRKIVISPSTGSPSSLETVRSSAGALSPSTHNIAVILYNFHATADGRSTCPSNPNFDFTSQPITPAQARSMTFTGTGNTSLTSGSSVNALFRESTYGNWQFTGDVFGWVTVRNTDGSWFYPCHPDGSVEVYDDSLAPLIRASTPGFNIDNYDVVIYASNFTDDSGSYHGNKIIWASSDKYERWPIFAHELGHAYGLEHAHSLHCLDSNGLPVPISDNCTGIEYGDFFDVMAAEVGFGHHDAYEKLQLGALDASSVRTVTSSGMYTLAPIELAPGTISGAYTALKIPALNVHGSYVDQAGRRQNFDRNMYYYVEFHANTGFDSGFSRSNGSPYSFPAPNGGVLVKFAPDPSVQGGSFAIQTRIPHVAPPPPDNIVYYPLPAGRAFADSAANVGIETVATTANSVTVHVSLNNGGPIGCAYGTTPVTYDGGVAIAPNSLSCAAGGPVTSCQVSPALPQGLVLNANCQITGTPWAAIAATTYAVTPANSRGTGFASINIAVRPAAPSGCRYAASPVTLYAGCPVSSISLDCFGGTGVTSCAISPALQSGLSLDASTCTIAGTASAPSSPRTYTVTPSNVAGRTTAPITISVIQPSRPHCSCPSGTSWNAEANRCETPEQTCRSQGCFWRYDQFHHRYACFCQ